MKMKQVIGDLIEPEQKPAQAADIAPASAERISRPKSFQYSSVESA